MLVIISDLHLTDGSSGETIKAGAFRIFRERLSDMAYDASWRRNGTYKPISRLDLVLLGDILDPIRSTRWLSDESGQLSSVRPWDDYTGQPFIDKIAEITTAILENNEESLRELRELTNDFPVTIPPATLEGQVADVPREPTDPRRWPVETHIHYMVGNHDWFYYLPGPAYDQIRGEIVKAMGLATPPQSPFPHDPVESATLSDLFAAHQVFARHGDIFDPFNFEERRDAPSLGDAVVVELLNRFPAEVRRRLGDVLPQPCLDGLKEVDNVRPVFIVPIWVNSLLNRTCSDTRQAQKVKDIWDELVDDFLALPFVRARDSAFNFFDSVDKLEWALKFTRGVSLQTISRVASWVREKTIGTQVTHYENALEETAFQQGQAKYIVNGHTHHREIVPLDRSMVEGERYDQLYFNTGTWRRVHEMARYAPQEQEFIGYHEMTYVAFFQGDERKGRPFEVWGGTLGG